VGGNNWIVDNILGALETWNSKLAEIWALISQNPQDFRGGGIWGVMAGIHGALQGIGLALLVIFFAAGIFKSAAGFQDFRRPEMVLRHFIRFVAAKVAVTWGMDIMVALYGIVAGIIGRVANSMGNISNAMASLPGEIDSAIRNVGFFNSIPLWLVSLLGSIIVTVLSFILILTVYSRFFRLFMFTALSPVPLSAFASDVTSGTGRAFVKSYLGVCMEGVIIVLACVIFSAFSGAPPVAAGSEAVTMVWGYLGETVFSMLVLVGLVKGADRICKEMMDL
jgi:hypothetical protein